MDKPRSRSPTRRRPNQPPHSLRPLGKSNGPSMQAPPASTTDMHPSPRPTTIRPTSNIPTYQPILPKPTSRPGMRSIPYRRSSLTNSLLCSKASLRPKTTLRSTTTTPTKSSSLPRPSTKWPPFAKPRPPFYFTITCTYHVTTIDPHW